MRGLRISPASALLSPPPAATTSARIRTPPPSSQTNTSSPSPLPLLLSSCCRSSSSHPVWSRTPPPLHLQLQQLRLRHVSLAPRPTQVPPPTPFVPDVPTLLKLIGRDLKKFADKFPTWEALFTLKSEELKELGVQPARTRKYLLRWLERFRNGEYGPGGDLPHVRDGVAALRVGRDLKRDTVWVVNIPLTEDTVVLPKKKSVKKGEEEEGGEKEAEAEAASSGGEQQEQKEEQKGKVYPGASTAKLSDFLEGMRREKHAVPREYHAHGTGRISGPYAMPNPREVGGATVRMTEGMWEERRGVKLDGGERRRKQVRFMRKVDERRALREARDAEEAAKRGGG